MHFGFHLKSWSEALRVWLASPPKLDMASDHILMATIWAARSL